MLGTLKVVLGGETRKFLRVREQEGLRFEKRRTRLCSCGSVVVIFILFYFILALENNPRFLIVFLDPTFMQNCTS